MNESTPIEEDLQVFLPNAKTAETWAEELLQCGDSLLCIVYKVNEIRAETAAHARSQEKARADQLWLNFKWVIERVERIHHALCPAQRGTWQQRLEQAVEAAEKLAAKSHDAH